MRHQTLKRLLSNILPAFLMFPLRFLGEGQQGEALSNFKVFF